MKTTVMVSSDGKRRLHYLVECRICQSEFWVRKQRLERLSPTCSVKCRSVARELKVESNCALCGADILRQKSKVSEIMFCDRDCKERAQSKGMEGVTPPHYGKALIPSYRKRALRWLSSKCQRCGYDKEKKMLDVDHIDGNRKNGAEGNLQVLCVWCHALKTRRVDGHDRLGK